MLAELTTAKKKGEGVHQMAYDAYVRKSSLKETRIKKLLSSRWWLPISIFGLGYL